MVPEEAVELAICACTSYISFREHEDIEDDGKVRDRGREGREGEQKVYTLFCLISQCVQLKKTEWRSLVNYFYQLTL